MKENERFGAIHVKDVSLWAHVGVFEKERLLGQEFRVDFSLWIDIFEAAQQDNLSTAADYSIAIENLQKLSSEISCLTIEKFIETILDRFEELYGKIPMKVLLTKCRPPVEGFNGTVQIEKTRNFSVFN
tara:strand:+ start:816 stop:1202 length:387 start_codon:yes stop_codon:yes gene_type:complete